MNAIDRFAQQASAFEQWLRFGTDRDADAARGCLVRLLDLYRAALELPPEWSDELEGQPDVEGDDDAALQIAKEAVRRLPFDLYHDTYDPTDLEDEDRVMSSLCDDLGDIYGDVATGLRAYESGNAAAANWEWAFGLHAHWGAHATGAIRALHWWLCNHAPGHLPGGDAS